MNNLLKKIGNIWIDFINEDVCVWVRKIVFIYVIYMRIRFLFNEKFWVINKWIIIL